MLRTQAGARAQGACAPGGLRGSCSSAMSMKPKTGTLLALLVLAFVGSSALGCGSKEIAARSSSAASRNGAAVLGSGTPGAGQSVSTPLKRGKDGDGDGETTEPGFDRDDSGVRYYGHAASAPVRTAVSAVIARYYAALAADDGASACSMLDAALAEGLSAASGSQDSRSKGCAKAVARLTKGALGRSPADFLAVKVMTVRTMGDKALAVLRLRSSEIREIPLESDQGAWKIGALFDGSLN
jgi:hypothetical protein